MSMKRGKIYIAHVADGLAPEVRELGESLGAVFVDVTGDRFGYHRLFRGAWERGESFINLEQDILPTVAQLDEMWQCESDWCSLEYPFPNVFEPDQPPTLMTSFGCVKFGGRLLRRDIFHEPPLRKPVPWNDLDARVISTVREDPVTGEWYFPHVHGRARHLSVEADYPILKPWRQNDVSPLRPPTPVGDAADYPALADKIVSDHLLKGS